MNSTFNSSSNNTFNTYLHSATHIESLLNGERIKTAFTIQDKLIYTYLLAHPKPAHIPTKQLAAHCALSVSTCERSCKKLESLGIITSELRRTKDGNLYHTEKYYLHVINLCDTGGEKRAHRLVSDTMKAYRKEANKTLDNSTANSVEHTPSEWRTYHANLAYELQRGYYFTGEERGELYSVDMRKRDKEPRHGFNIG